ncbi:MAG: hypothetical protein GY832_28595 [Chloroflexi bacterium]|nr:hypothetical protein [Chloroflexota bacterium]
MRGTERIFGIARQTLARWIIEKAAALPDTLERAKADDMLELDEMWSFVLKKSKNGGYRSLYVVAFVK